MVNGYVFILYSKDVFQCHLWKIFGSFRVWHELTKFSFWGRNNSQTDSSYKTKYCKASKIVLLSPLTSNNSLGDRKEEVIWQKSKGWNTFSWMHFYFFQSLATFSENYIDLCRRARGWKKKPKKIKKISAHFKIISRIYGIISWITQTNKMLIMAHWCHGYMTQRWSA